VRDGPEANGADSTDGADALQPVEVALRRLRMVGIAVIAAAVVISALEGPYTRWRIMKARIAMRFDPLDPSEGVLVSIVADLLSATDGLAAPRTLR
jgi:hypothetical protein